jgi:transposase
LIRARDLLVRLRTAAVNAVRGLTKSCGHRMPASSTRCFAKRGLAVMPPGLQQALDSTPADCRDDSEDQAVRPTDSTSDADRVSGDTGAAEGARRRPYHRLTFVLTLGNKERFKRSRDVRCYLGLRPRRSQSGEHDPQLGITKAGNVYLRSLLIECARFCSFEFG